MDENITFLSKMVHFYLLIRNDKALRVKKYMSTKLNDIVKQMNMFQTTSDKVVKG